MSDRLTEIRARLDAATPGPWECGNDGGGFCWVNRVAPAYGWYTHHADTRTMEDAQFIAHAPADIAWLLDRVRDLEAGIVTACQIGVRGTTGQEAQALASLMHDLNVPGVENA